MREFATMIADAVVDTLEKKQIIREVNVNGNVEKHEKTAYQKTEQLLYNYIGFKKIVQERMDEIDEIKKYGVPKRTPIGGNITGKGGTPRGLVLEEESVDAAVHRISSSVESTVQAISLIDNCMASLKSDPYYMILEMRYFDGRTQEDIAAYFGVTQVTISKNKSRLVRELAMRLFPNQAIQEMFGN